MAFVDHLEVHWLERFGDLVLIQGGVGARRGGEKLVSICLLLHGGGGREGMPS